MTVVSATAGGSHMGGAAMVEAEAGAKAEAEAGEGAGTAGTPPPRMMMMVIWRRGIAMIVTALTATNTQVAAHTVVAAAVRVMEAEGEG